jgi:hypothetical protein
VEGKPGARLQLEADFPVAGFYRVLVFRPRGRVKHRERRGARGARREEGEYREYLTDEQRSDTGRIDARMRPYLADGTLVSCFRSSLHVGNTTRPILGGCPVPYQYKEFL